MPASKSAAAKTIVSLQAADALLKLIDWERVSSLGQFRGLRQLRMIAHY
jgi:hypothetical protein